MVAAEINSSYRNSVAWQKGMELAALIYKVTQGFPVDERFGLTNQLRRAAVSIPSNIAEGKGRLTTGEFIQFLRNRQRLYPGGSNAVGTGVYAWVRR